MSDAPADRLRGLGLLVQLVAAVTFVAPATAFVMYVFDDHFAVEIRRLWYDAAPLVSLVLQFVTGWAIVHQRHRAVPFAVATLVVAFAILAVAIVDADDIDPLSVATRALSIAGWPTATLIAVLCAPRTPSTPRRADLGGAVLAYGLMQLVVTGLWVVGIALEMSSMFREFSTWELVLSCSPLLGVMVTAVFAVLAGVELAGAPRPGRSRLTMYLMVSTIVTVLLFALTFISLLVGDRFGRANSTALQVVLLVVGFANFYAVPFVVWRYARRAKPLDVADSAGAAASVRWAALYLAIPMTVRVLEQLGGSVRRFSAPQADLLGAAAFGFHGLGAFALASACAQIVFAIAIFAVKRRRLAMWISLGACMLSIANIAIVIIETDLLRSAAGLWPSSVSFGAFGALAWLHRPGVRSERSLAAIFE
jgi:hypothetical protein